MSGATEPRVVTLAAMCELRFESQDPAGVVVTLTSGKAECFGAELVPSVPLTFPTGAKTAVFSWEGCTLTVAGACHHYVSETTPAEQYATLHADLDGMRRLATSPTFVGPTIVVAGPPDSGKSSLCRLLLSYAARSGHSPVYVDVDVGRASGIPGTVWAASVRYPPPPVEGLSSLFTSGSPVVFFHGHSEPERQPDVLRLLVEKLAEVVRQKMQADPQARCSGVVVNTYGSLDAAALTHTIDAFKAELVAVIEHERLYYDLKERLRDHPEVSLQRVAKSAGVVAHDHAQRSKSRAARIREYFYGPSGDLFPHAAVVPFSDVSLFNVVCPPAPPASALPIGAKPQSAAPKLVPVFPSPALCNSLVAVCSCSDASEVIGANAVGFVFIQKVDMEKSLLHFLAPCPGPLPSRFLVVGSIKWAD
eukprot:m51a1_g3247 hypothetical protein (420) ;mRNA; f:140764-142356